MQAIKKVEIENCTLDQLADLIDQRAEQKATEKAKSLLRELGFDEVDYPMQYFLETLPGCKSRQTFRKLIRERQIQPNRIESGIPRYKPSQFLNS